MNTNRSIIDQLIDLCDIKKDAADAYDSFKDEVFLKEFDMGLHEGTEKNVQVFLSQKSVMDYKKLFDLYGITEEQFKLFSACKKDGETFTVVKVVEKKKKKGPTE